MLLWFVKIFENPNAREILSMPSNLLNVSQACLNAPESLSDVSKGRGFTSSSRDVQTGVGDVGKYIGGIQSGGFTLYNVPRRLKNLRGKQIAPNAFGDPQRV